MSPTRFRTARPRSPAIFVALVVQLALAGCYTWSPVVLTPDVTENVRLTMASGESRFEGAALQDGSTVHAFTDSSEVRIPLASIDVAERRHFDWVMTTGVGLILAVGWICIWPGC